MNSSKSRGALTAALLLACGVDASTSNSTENTSYLENSNFSHPQLEEVVVWSKGSDSQSSGYTNPTSLLTKADMLSINLTTTEDVVKYEPSIVIRKRFIGDANGTLGIRGANMFQTPRSMVFADGVPLHYFLESRWKGAPRWTMVAVSEIAQVEVVYGPFSAEYSGNAMGGVVLIESAIPQEQELHIDAAFFRQEFRDYGFDDTLDGFKGFISYGNRLEKFSYYLSYNHLQNESQAQVFRDSGTVSASNDSPTPVTGAIIENDSRSRERFWYGDTGIVDTQTDNYKIKLGYEFGNWATLLNIAYEDRNSVADSANSYLQDNAGQTVWSGLVSQDGELFNVSASRLNESELNRQSLSLGLRLRGSISYRLSVEANINQFKILKDETRSSASNPEDSNYTLNGQISDYHNSGWRTADIKFTLEDLFTHGLELISGARHEDYELNLDDYSSLNYKAGSKDAFSSRFGGKSSIDALFGQFNWDLNTLVDMAFGLRYERYTSSGGYYGDDNEQTPEYDLTYIPQGSATKTSPKFSLGLKPGDDWLIRYSFAKAYRFPIIEELFSQYKRFNAESIPSPGLQPENGSHHNLLLEKMLEAGYLRVNFFQETIKNAIEAQQYPNGLRTFSAIDKVNTLGVEFVANQYDMFIDGLDVRFNLAYTDAEIIENKIDTSIEGNTFPRQPKWRGNLLATYHLSEHWNIGGSIQYASDSFARNDNKDYEDNVYGAQDSLTRLGLKTNIDINQHINLSFGIDNLTNEIAYVAHPWPGRTLYLSFSYDM